MQNNKGLSKAQQKVYNFVKEYSEERGYPPSVREICDGVGLTSTSTVHGHLHRLESKGYIYRDPAKPRALEITELRKERSKFCKVPIVGRVTAGNPILAQQDIQEYITLPITLTKGENSFLLTVKGESMIEAGILDGDKIVVNPNMAVENGDIVVAMIADSFGEDCATVKRFFKEFNRIRLQPENPRMEPIYVDNCTIVGKVIGLIRYM